jgi:hypothetical protein
MPVLGGKKIVGMVEGFCLIGIGLLISFLSLFRNVVKVKEWPSPKGGTE